MYFDPREILRGVQGGFVALLRDFPSLQDHGHTPATAVKSLIGKIAANTEFREQGRLVFAHLPLSMDGYRVIRLNPITLDPQDGPWMERNYAEERRLAAAARQNAQESPGAER